MSRVRTNVTLPGDLVRAIDRVAGSRHRSAFLAEAAAEKLARLRFARVSARAFGSWRDQDHPDLISEGDMGAYLRRIRGGANRRIRRRLSRG